MFLRWTSPSLPESLCKNMLKSLTPCPRFKLHLLISVFYYYLYLLIAFVNKRVLLLSLSAYCLLCSTTQNKIVNITYSLLILCVKFSVAHMQTKFRPTCSHHKKERFERTWFGLEHFIILCWNTYVPVVYAVYY